MTSKYPHQLMKPAGIAGEVLTSNGLASSPSFQIVGIGGGDPAQIGSEIFVNGVDFTAGVSNSITLTATPTSESKILVFFNGGLQQRDQYSLLVNVITFNTIITSNVDRIEVYVLSGGITGAFSNKFTSANQVIAAGGLVTIAHGLGAVPFDYSVELVCVIAEFGYSIGDVIKPSDAQYSILGKGKGVTVDTLDGINLICIYGEDINTFNILNKTTGKEQQITNTNWNMRLKAWL